MSEKITFTLPMMQARQWPDLCKIKLGEAWQWKKDLVVTFKPAESNRSVKQNRLLWMLHGELAKHIHESQGEIYDTETIHEFVIGKLLPKEPKKLPDGDFIIARKSTKNLPVKEFAALLDMYYAWALIDMGCNLPMPDDLYFDAVMKERK
jgi:hypothetical protein